MRILVIFAHPSRDGLCGSILDKLLEELKEHTIEVVDLYAMKFNPVLTADELRLYEKGLRESSLTSLEDQIRQCEGMIWVYPTWNGGMPAIMKGYLDRLWRPDIAFRIDKKRNIHFDLFDHIRLFAVITTFGSNRITNWILGNPSKKLATRLMRRHFPQRCKSVWLAIYNVDQAAPAMPQINTKLRLIKNILDNKN